MPNADNEALTRLLQSWRNGDDSAATRLLGSVYGDLRRIAGSYMRNERPSHTLQATALVHEAYIRLVGSADPGWQNRAHFFAAAAEAMRRILIDSARRRARIRHGGERQQQLLTDSMLIHLDRHVDLLVLDEALARLESEDPAKAELVKLRFFAGLSIEQAIAVLGISRATADRWWAYARAFLFVELRGGPSAESERKSDGG